jgi:hypothetical protein
MKTSIGWWAAAVVPRPVASARATAVLVALLSASCVFRHGAQDFIPKSGTYVSSSDETSAEEVVVSDGNTAVILVGPLASPRLKGFVEATDAGLVARGAVDHVWLPADVSVGAEWPFTPSASREGCTFVRRVAAVTRDGAAVEVWMQCGEGEKALFDRERWGIGLGLLESENVVHGAKVVRKLVAPPPRRDDARLRETPRGVRDGGREEVLGILYEIHLRRGG